MNRSDGLEDHQKFKELAALERVRALSDSEWLALERHLQVCDSCRQACDEYSLISTEGMSFLAVAYGYSRDSEDWDDRAVRKSLLARVRSGIHSIESRSPAGSARMSQPTMGQPGMGQRGIGQLSLGRPALLRSGMAEWATAAIAACVLFAVGAGAYHLGSRVGVAQQRVMPVAARVQEIAPEKKTDAQELITWQREQLGQLQVQVLSGEQEVARLQDALHAADVRSAALTSGRAASDEQLKRALDQRDKLSVQLHDAEQSYQLVQAELTNLRAEHERVLLHTTSLESKIDELNASSRDRDRRLADDEQYLASDRDIRELMGARKLYIADVFDVDSHSRTRKPFGRVFYTQSKSLIFYAFDLDHEPGVKNASAFQVWGQKDSESGEKNHATNLGILFMDSDSNRRWVLRLDDPKQLAELDAVFVTVEPHGGSQKPTGKPFLYALLRKEANHP